MCFRSRAARVYETAERSVFLLQSSTRRTQRNTRTRRSSRVFRPKNPSGSWGSSVFQKRTPERFFSEQHLFLNEPFLKNGAFQVNTVFFCFFCFRKEERFLGFLGFFFWGSSFGVLLREKQEEQQNGLEETVCFRRTLLTRRTPRMFLLVLLRQKQTLAASET